MFGGGANAKVAGTVGTGPSATQPTSAVRSRLEQTQQYPCRRTYVSWHCATWVLLMLRLSRSPNDSGGLSAILRRGRSDDSSSLLAVSCLQDSLLCEPTCQHLHYFL